jgi:3-phenylpropionate/trans-cinnamate dioxygenase ferredoxin subunit
MAFTKVADMADIPENGALAVEIDGEEVALVRAADQVYAIRDVCSHAEVKLSEGEVTFDDDGTPEIECWLHGSTFNLKTGEPVILPATEPVPIYPTQVDGDVVLVDIEGTST